MHVLYMYVLSTLLQDIIPLNSGVYDSYFFMHVLRLQVRYMLEIKTHLKQKIYYN